MEAKKHVFSTLEKKLFIDIVKKYEQVIENKNTDGTTVKNKNSAWDLIAREYNASPVTTSQASTKQLLRLWLNLKQRQRDVLTKERQHRLATGGGPPISDAVMDPDLCIFTPGLLVSVPGAIDSDTASEMVTEQFSVEMTNEPEDSITLHNPIESSIHSSQAEPILVFSPEHTQPTTSKASKTYQNQKKILLEQEYRDRKARANQIHELEVKILHEKLREAKANADLAEHVLKLRKGDTRKGNDDYSDS